MIFNARRSAQSDVFFFLGEAGSVTARQHYRPPASRLAVNPASEAMFPRLSMLAPYIREGQPFKGSSASFALR
jgi:hypothetical protein